MFSAAQIEEVLNRLKAGDTPEQIAVAFGIALNTLRARLANSGYRIATRRDLERIGSVDISMETAVARVSP